MALRPLLGNTGGWPDSLEDCSMPLALYALTAGAFGIGVTEFVIMGLLI